MTTGSLPTSVGASGSPRSILQPNALPSSSSKAPSPSSSGVNGPNASGKNVSGSGGGASSSSSIGGGGKNTAQARRDATSARTNPAWAHYLSAAVLAGVLLGGLLRWLLLDGGDPVRCETYLTRGRWLDKGSWRNWQPEGCIHAPPDAKVLQRCFSPSETRFPPAAIPAGNIKDRSHHLLFIGDSIVRQVFFAATKLADPSLPATPEEAGGEKHSDRHVVAGSLEFEFWWDPYLNTSRTIEHLSKSTPSPDGLLVLGSGLWYLRHPSSGGIAAWTRTVNTVFDAVAASQPLIASRPLHKPPPFLTAGDSPKGGLAEAIVYLPVVQPVEDLLSPDRRTISHADVEAMNADLAARLLQPSAPPLKVPSVFNELLIEAETTDGLHFSEKIIRKQAEILLGWRCNDAASEVNGACCRRYATVRPAQWLVLLGVCCWAPLAMLLRHSASVSPSLKSSLKHYLPNEKISLPLAIFGFAIAFMFLADRTTVFLHEQKEYNPWIFGTLMIGSLVAGLATMVRRDKDMGFLNREQTDEWKGWMQIAILIYHWFGASKVSGVYNAIRVLVASYLFMTGYGHFTYYYKKKDFGFQRVAMVMVRLNLLSVVLPYTMNTDYAFYYFAPLVSWWYMIIYATMWAGHQFNDRPPFMLVKLVLSAAGVAAVMHHSWILEHAFDFLHAIFGIRWSAREWSFRVSLDLYIVYGGMLCAYAFIKLNEYRISQRTWWPILRNAVLAASVLAMAWYFYFELTLESKFVYNNYHAVVSFVPILAFIALRNATPVLRSSSSRLFMFIGQCSLETFILQFHMWLASDTRAVLMVIPYVSWRPVNLLCSTIAFVWLSYKVSIATGDITEWAIGKPKTQQRGGRGLPVPATTPGSTSSNANAATTSASSSGGGAPLPEAIPLVARDGSANLGGDDDDEEVIKTASRAPNVFSKHVAALAESARGSTAVRLGLVLLVLWGVNLVY